MKIIEIYLPQIEKMAFIKTGNVHDGMDLVQDVCERLLVKRDLLEHLPIIDQRKYVNRVLHNVFIEKKRVEKRERRNKELYLNEQVFSIQPICVRRLAALEKIRLIINFIKSNRMSKLAGIKEVKELGVNIELHQYPARKKVTLVFFINGKEEGVFIEKKVNMVKAGEYIIDMYIAKLLPEYHRIISGEIRYNK